MPPDVALGAINELSQAFADFRANHDGRVDGIENRLDEFEARMNRSSLGSPGSQPSAGEREERKALDAFARNGGDFRLERQAGYSTDHDPSGGYAVVPALSDKMTKRLFDQSPVARLARTETLTVGDAWEEPYDADDIGAAWVGEREARPETESGELGMLRVPVGEIYSLQKVTQRMLDDSKYNIGAWLEGKISDKIGRGEGEAYVTGDGAKGKPKGFLTYPTATAKDAERPWGTLQHVPSGAAAAVTADGLISIKHRLRAPFRNGAVWLMNTSTQERIALLKDAEGRYLFNEVTNKLLGFPVELDETMPDVAAGSLPIAFGNFGLGYVRVVKAGIKFLRDPFTDKPNVLFYAYARRGGAVQNFDAIKLMKVEAGS